jgi:LacI family transcriptional regulator
MHEALSQRLARQFRQKIETGEWAVGKRLPTTRALAAELRVSINTVQNAFRHLEAHDLVERRPRLGGFVKAKPSRAASLHAPAPRRVTVLGVVSRFSENPDADDFGHNIVRGCARAAGEAGIHLAMYPFSYDDPTPVRSLLSTIDNTAARAAGVLGGILVFPSAPVLPLLEELDRRQIAWVTINRRSATETHNFVSFDAFGGSRTIGRAFARAGIDRAVVLSDNFGPGKSTADKYFGFLQGFIEGGMPSRNVDYIDCDSYQEVAGYERMKRYVDDFGPPRGVYASGDFLALGASRLMRERGLKIPEQVAIVGSTGLHVAAYATPSLSVLQVPMEQMGREAARMLIDMSRNGQFRIEGRFVPASLLVRESFVVAPEVLAEIRSAIAT